ncbi:hypothetical protein HJC99_03855 [Candidatus Saccharibacteria bacterium]|nr:hypothetical protein [Candidatus Saccharibacteria bacterium]
MKSAVRFDCQMYISGRGAVQVAMPVLSPHRREARLEPISFETLADPSFGRLLLALDNLPQIAL